MQERREDILLPGSPSVRGKEAMSSKESNWRMVASTADLDDVDAIQVTVDDTEIAIYKVEDKYYATSGICTHAQARLCEGYVEGDAIECPLHSGRFHIPTGKAIGAPATDDLRVYPLRIEGSNIHIRLD